jgi:O-antigen/teichoic acid export membrane protein
VSLKESAAAGRLREHVSFFRQSGWMLLATSIAGAFFMLVHTPASSMVGNAADPAAGKAQYALFVTLLDSMILLSIPALGLERVFAQLTASAIDDRRKAELRSAVRRVLMTVTLLWLLVAGGLWFRQDAVLAGWKVTNPAALWLTLLAALVGLWIPVFNGLLQGSQRFLWLGNAGIALGAGRLAGVTVAVVALGWLAAGAMGGVLAGAVISLAIAVWTSRDEWRGPVSSEGGWKWWRPWLLLTLGLAAGNVMLSWDSLLVQRLFGDEGNAFYFAAGRVGRGLVAFTTPVAIVLFPKIARSAATGEPTGALKLALGATLGTGVLAALACTAMPTLPIRALYANNPEFLPAAKLVPWFCWCMLPLTAANTLVSYLMARGRYSVVPWLLAVAIGYAGVLWAMRERLEAMPLFDAFRWIVQTLGVFNALLLLVSVVFALRRAGAAKAAPPA